MTMRALVCHELTADFSGVEVREVPKPEPGPGEILLKVHATSLNFPDLLMTMGLYQNKLKPPFIPGFDVSGIVEAVGEGVTHLKPDDAAAGGAMKGGFAEYAVLRDTECSAKPENFSFAEAAAYPVAYLTAYVSLVRRANLQAGQTLLVHGAAGGVGLAAVDVGKLLGATVIATSASDKKLDAVLEYGADHVINVSQGFREKVKALTNGRGADVIFDPIGGDVFDESTRCIAFDGSLLVIGFTSGRIAEVKTNIPLIKGFSVVGVRAGEYDRQFPEKGRENSDAIWKWAREGKTRPRIHMELPMINALDGFKMMLNREIIGKLVIRMDA